MSEKTKPFVRQATGLVREISPWSSFFGTFFLMAGGGPILLISLLYVAPGANFPLAEIIAFVPTLGLAVLYTWFGMSMPRAGGDYVFVTRGLNPAIGFISSFALFLAYQLSNGLFEYFASGYVGNTFAVFGIFGHNQSFINLGVSLTGNTPSVVIGTVLTILGFVLAILRPRITWSFVFWIGIITAIGSVVMLATLASFTQPTFTTSYNSFLGNSTAYQNVIDTASSTGLVSNGGSAAFATALLLAWYNYSWYQVPTLYGGELKQVKRALKITVIYVSLVVGVFYTLFIYLAQRAFGQAFLTSLSYLVAQGSPPVAGIGNYIPFYAYLVVPNAIVDILIFLGLWLPSVFFIIPNIIGGTRYLFSMSFDRVLPESLANVNQRFHTPISATFVAFVLSELGLVLYAFVPAFALVAFLPIFLFGYMFVPLSSILLPYFKKDLYKNVFVVKQKFFGVPVLVLLGTAVLAYMVAATLSIVGGPLLPVSVNSLIAYAIMYGLGISIYLLARYRNQRRGIDLNMIFNEIPPE